MYDFIQLTHDSGLVLPVLVNMTHISTIEARIDGNPGCRLQGLDGIDFNITETAHAVVALLDAAGAHVTPE